jgi:hypothetical protein
LTLKLDEFIGLLSKEQEELTVDQVAELRAQAVEARECALGMVAACDQYLKLCDTFLVERMSGTVPRQ